MDNKSKIHKYTVESQEIITLRKSDEQLDFVIQLIGTLEYKIHDDPFIHFMDTIIGQMLSNKVGDIISKRFYDICNNEVTPEVVCQLTVDDLRLIGLSRDKSEYLLNFARFIHANPKYFEDINQLSDAELLKSLQQHRGIGGWSAKMYAIFVLDRKDILPYEDGAFLQSFKWLYGVEEKNRNHPIIQNMCKKWSPYSSLAARYLYRVLDGGYIKKNINDVKTNIHYTPLKGL